MERGEKKKKERLGERGGSDGRGGAQKKGGWVLRSSFGVPLVCRERSPQGPGLGLGCGRAWNRSCCSLGMGARPRVQLALLCRALPPG